MRPRATDVTSLLLAATLSMTVADFIELQKLSPEELRSRFGLPAACDPAVMASTPATGGNTVTVAVECRAPAEGLPVRSPATAPARPGRPGQRGS
jgi:hypothetical protein